MNLVKIGKACILTCSMLVACVSCSDDKNEWKSAEPEAWEYSEDMDVSVIECIIKLF